MGKFYTTTAIPYVNAKPHIGFAQELVEADVLARFRRAAGDDVFFLTGTDDNALKNVQAAETAGATTAAYVDESAAVFENLTKALAISNNHFVRTARADHFAGAQKLWSLCTESDIYKKKYKGLYCVGCETFYMPDELVNGKCPEHNRVPEEVEEENYFFKLSNYQKVLEELIVSDKYRITPASRKNEMLSFIRMGLADFSISRSVSRAKGWGVPVPGDNTQIMYVWFDALANYLTGLGFGRADDALFKKYWPADVHVIGKGITRFHAIYWPAMLLSAGLQTPRALFVHGYIKVDGRKMSKSLGNVVDPFPLVETYGSDAVRFYLLKHVHPFEDSDFTTATFKEAYNADLANGLGNLLSRVTNMIEKFCDGKLENAAAGPPQDSKMREAVQSAMEVYDFKGAMEEIWKEVRVCNVLIDEQKPWVLAKVDMPAVKELLRGLVVKLAGIAGALTPFMPHAASRITAALTAPRIVKVEPLFGRMNTP